MVLYNKLRATKAKLVNRLKYQPNLIKKAINLAGEIQITDVPSLFQYKKLKNQPLKG